MNDQQYKSHSLHGTVARLLAMRDNDIFREPGIANDPELNGAKDRIFALGTLLARLLADTPPSLAGHIGMNTIEAQLQPVLGELSALQSTRNTGHLSNAATNIDSVQPYLWTFAPTATVGGSSLLPELLAEQAQTARETITALVASGSDAGARITALHLEIAGLVQQLKDLSDGAAKERAEATASVAKLETAFAKEQLERDAANAKSAELRDEGFRLEIQNAKGAADGLLSELGGKRDEANRIVQIVGNIGVTGNYQQIAVIEGQEANKWRYVTVGIFSIGITIAVFTFVRYWGEPVTGTSAISIAVRLMYAIAITAPAWYTAKESARHRTNADRAKQTELELASIGPFIELMPDDKKNDIREELTKRYFGRVVDEHTAEHPIAFSDAKDLLIEAIKAVRK